jgi:predicted nucleotide-binding protein
MPPQPVTVEMAPPPPWAIALGQKVESGFAAVNSRLDSLETSDRVQLAMGHDLQQRVTQLAGRVDAHEERLNTGSMRAKAISITDEKHDSSIADLSRRVDTCAEQIQTLTTQSAATHAFVGDARDAIASAAKHPLVQRLVTALIMLALAWVAYATQRIQTRVDQIPAQHQGENK